MIDISLGQAAPLLPTAQPGSTARRTIEQLLPALVEDARAAADNADHVTRMSAQIDTDPLTGLGNRRGLGRIRGLVKHDTIVMLDLDHFKQVNDAHGHDGGDRLLVAFSRMLRQRLLHWEDFGADNARRVPARYADSCASFNDDLQGTAAVVLAAVFSALTVSGTRMRDQRVVIHGAGTATRPYAATCNRSGPA